MPVIIRFDGIYPPRDVMQVKGDQVFNALKAALKGPVTSLVSGEMRNRTQGWSGTPDMDMREIDSPQRLGIEILPKGTGSKKWRWVSLGTKPHTISARRKPYLFIREGYTPFTGTGNSYGRGGGGSYSGTYHLAASVQHPGIKPRSFEEHIAREVTDDIQRILEGAVKAATK